MGSRIIVARLPFDACFIHEICQPEHCELLFATNAYCNPILDIQFLPLTPSARASAVGTMETPQGVALGGSKADTMARWAGSEFDGITVA
jgi:hypothetical protein